MVLWFGRSKLIYAANQPHALMEPSQPRLHAYQQPSRLRCSLRAPYPVRGVLDCFGFGQLAGHTGTGPDGQCTTTLMWSLILNSLVMGR